MSLSKSVGREGVRAEDRGGSARADVEKPERPEGGARRKKKACRSRARERRRECIVCVCCISRIGLLMHYCLVTCV